jgi:hypothetical protein
LGIATAKSDLVSMLTVAVSGGYVNLGPTYFPLIKLNKEVKCATKVKIVFPAYNKASKFFEDYNYSKQKLIFKGCDHQVF